MVCVRPDTAPLSARGTPAPTSRTTLCMVGRLSGCVYCRTASSWANANSAAVLAWHAWAAASTNQRSTSGTGPGRVSRDHGATWWRRGLPMTLPSGHPSCCSRTRSTNEGRKGHERGAGKGPRTRAGKGARCQAFVKHVRPHAPAADCTDRQQIAPHDDDLPQRLHLHRVDAAVGPAKLLLEVVAVLPLLRPFSLPTSLLIHLLVSSSSSSSSRPRPPLLFFLQLFLLSRSAAARRLLRRPADRARSSNRHGGDPAH